MNELFEALATSFNVDGGEVALWVETRREGMLAPIGHDLRLEATELTVAWDADRSALAVVVQAESVRVRAALMGQRERPRALNGLERKKIKRTIAREVLAVGRYPTIAFEGKALRGEGAGALMQGEVTIRGTTRPVSLRLKAAQGGVSAEAELRLSDFGIPPVTAFVGALRVQDKVKICASFRARS